MNVANTVTAIVGQGAIGLLAASQLALHQCPFHLLLRQPQSNSLVLNFRQQQQDYPLLLNCQPPEQPITLLLVPVKAFSVQSALQQWLPLCAADADIVLCHNGMGTLAMAQQQLLPKQKLWFASTTHGALKSGPHQLEHTGIGRTILGPVNDVAKNAVAPATLLNAALGPVEVVTDILPVLWQKLAINAVINPLTALLMVKNGELTKPQYRAHIDQLVVEFCKVAWTQGQRFDALSLLQTVLSVAANTAGNYSSMQQDRALQRPDELEFITGFLLRTAAEAGIAIPAHQQLYQQLRAVKPA
ncbi:ketopantoate reductase family protein [Rheinheimera texasensis]|uniref:ketopantoate reductase family protein n=1 Tax=Rheinheimera texasensis TaxID=306205 RepID=UPI0004E1A0D3|nr:2-dehydropantoate 2-reductase [Rheinheimera texasensis]